MVTTSAMSAPSPSVQSLLRPVVSVGSVNGAPTPLAPQIAIEIDDVDFCYGASKALHDITLNIAARQVTAFIGPSGCGKSTLLRCLNRMNDLIDGARVTDGQIRIDGVNIYDPRVDVIELRKRVGMVFQKSNPFPKSIYDNITYGLRIQGRTIKPGLMKSWKKVSAGRPCGMRSRTVCMRAPWGCRAVSSSGSALRARLR